MAPAFHSKVTRDPALFQTAVDPRLNRSQSLDLAFTVAENYRRLTPGNWSRRPTTPGY